MNLDYLGFDWPDEETFDIQSDVFKYISSKEGWTSNNWYPSSIHNFCARFEIINRSLPKEKRYIWKPDNSLSAILDAGTIYHSWWQNEYLAKSGLLWGKWECLKCGKQHIGFHHECYDCGEAVKYVELRIKIPIEDVFISGKVDAIIKKNGKYYVYDLKTIKSDKWEVISDISPTYRTQLQLYIYAIKNGFVEIKVPEVEDIGYIGYIGKDQNQIRSVALEYKPEIAEKVIENVRFVELARAGKEEIPEKKCRRKKCELLDYCKKIKTYEDLLKLGDNNGLDC